MEECNAELRQRLCQADEVLFYRSDREIGREFDPASIDPTCKPIGYGMDILIDFAQVDDFVNATCESFVSLFNIGVYSQRMH